MIVIFSLIMLAGLAFAVWTFVRTRGEPMIRRVVDVMMAIATAGAVYMLIGRTMQIGISDWNDAKLAPVIAMTRNFPLYQDPTTGVMTGWIYGPVGAIVLLPAAIAKDPTTAGLIGSFISAIFYFAPAFWLFFIAARGRVRWLIMLAILVLVWRTIYIEDLCRCAFIASPDGPALGLGALACAFIYGRRTMLTLALSAIAALLCVWTKQNFLPLLLALVLWVGLTDGWKQSAIYLGIMAGIGLVISGILLASFGASNMKYHMIWLPQQHPMALAAEGIIWMWYSGISSLILTCMAAIGMVLMVFLLDAWIRQPAKNVVNWFASRAWSLPLLVAIFLIPSSLLGYMKIGGFVNNLACTDYFLFLAALCGVLETCAQFSDSTPQPQAAQKWVISLVSTVMGLLILPMAMNAAFGSQNNAFDIWKPFSKPYTNSKQIVYNYVLAHPKEVFCPWNPLITLMADGELYHFEWGFMDRGYANSTPSPKQVFDHLPKSISKIVYIGTPQSTFMQQGLNVKLRQVEIPELPGCAVFVQ